jgi:hypothetical protein
MSDREGNEAATDEVFAENPLTELRLRPPSRLSIIHLFGWMTVVAVLLAIMEWLSKAELHPQRDGFAIFRDIFTCALSGIAVSSLVLMFARRWKGVPFPVEPGEWILVVVGLTTLIHLAARAVWTALPRAVYYENLWPIHISQWLMLLPRLWAIRCVQPPRWKAFFWIGLFLGLALAILTHTPQWFETYWKFQFAASALMILTVSLLWRMDRREGIDRGWLHRVGLAFVYLSALNMIIFAIAMQTR